MFSAIYFESAVRDHPRTRAILRRYRDLPQIECERYGEIFNRKSQNFRLQKENPALILARKHGGKVLPAPGGYGFDAAGSHYFSHMLNCIYDCRYCFLQGMYRSAHCVLFVNYEDYAAAIEQTLSDPPLPREPFPKEDIHRNSCQSARSRRISSSTLPTRSCDSAQDDGVGRQAQGDGVAHLPTGAGEVAPGAGQVFYSGYDCDSLAFEPVSGFAEYFVPWFAARPRAILELRTKSTQIGGLLKQEPIPNCIIAMSFTTHAAAARWEHGVPAIDKRLAALRRLQEAGWPVALRFEPLLPDMKPDACGELFEQVFHRLDPRRLHSVSSGLFRMPADYFRNALKLYPDEALFARETRTRNGVVALQHPNEEAWLRQIETALFRHIDPTNYYRCADENTDSEN